MRNGNRLHEAQAHTSRKQFNRIYEEWKPISISCWIPTWSCSIESMRNGNIKSTYTLLGTAYSSIESMRNGNSCSSWGDSVDEKVQSNLWGMETFTPWTALFSPALFNRIYEEWKHKFGVKNINSFTGSIESMRNGNFTFHLHPTTTLITFNRIYEEWKRLFHKPRRNPHNGSIESMRNGNQIQHVRCRVRFYVQSNLWGMETVLREKAHIRVNQVQSNLWGMETGINVLECSSRV